MAASPFFTLHRDLPREGPGNRAELDAALAQITLPDAPRILDAGCGPGADIEGLLDHAPDAQLTAIDGQEHFIAQVRARWGDDPRVTALCGNMLDAEGPFDLIWSAGALYFLGIETALAEMHKRLAPGGALIFSELVFLTQDPDPELHKQCLIDYAAIAHVCELEDKVRAAGYRLVSCSAVSDAAWEAYYTPMDARVKLLRLDAGAELTKVLDEAEAESALWRKYKRQFGYAQIVAVRET